MKMIIGIVVVTLFYVFNFLPNADANDNLILEIQTTLKKEGYDPGIIDGLWGNKTSLALKSFRKDKGLLDAGNILDEHTLTLLNIEMEKFKDDILVFNINSLLGPFINGHQSNLAEVCGKVGKNIAFSTADENVTWGIYSGGLNIDRQGHKIIKTNSKINISINKILEIIDINEEKNISDLLKSLLNQEEPYEVLVVDSDSKDKTQDIVKKYSEKNKNIKLFIHPGTRAESMNYGIKKATGDAIVFIGGSGNDNS